MSRTRYTKVATPANPPASTGELFYSSTLTPAALAFVDESGNVSRVAGLGSPDYRLIKVTEIFQGTTTYTPTSGASRLFVEGVGGGAGGGGCATAVTNNAAAGGGGSGAYTASWFTYAGGAITVQVGAGGAGGVAGANPGSVGTDTTFSAGATFTAKGGSGGAADTVSATVGFRGIGGVGGLASGGFGDIKAGGNDGGVGMVLTATLAALSGAGGPSHFGGAPQGRITQGAGATATAYGAGGAGATIIGGGASVAGGNGSNGILVCWEFA